MRHPRTTIAVIAVAAAAGVSGIAAAATTGGGSPTGGSATPKAVAAAVPSVAPATGATIHVATATVGGRAEDILENAQGLPLYFYKADTATKSFVSGGLASFWPPLDSANPTVAGTTGRLSVTHDANGAQVAFKGHFLYTFISDSPGRVAGQGVQDFFVATPGMAALGSRPAASTTPTPTSGSSGIYGY